MTTVHRTVLETTPEEAFDRLTGLLAGPHDTSSWEVGRLVRLRAGDTPTDHTVTAVEPPNVVVLEDAEGACHSIVVAPAVGGGAEVVWTTSEHAPDDHAAAVLGDVVLRGLLLAEPDGGAPEPAAPTGGAGHTGDAMTVLDHVLLDHSYLRTQLDRLCDADAVLQAGDVTALLSEVARHESAESALLRPRLRDTVDGDPVAASLDRQQREIVTRCDAVAEAAASDDETTLRSELWRLRRTFRDHCEAEEVAEHPRLRAGCPDAELQDLGRRYLSMTRVDVDLREEPVGRGRVDVRAAIERARAD